MATTRTSSAGKVSFGSWESEEREHPQGCSFFCALSSARGFCSPKGLLFYFSRTVRECALRGIFSFLGKRISPFNPQEKGIRLAVWSSNNLYASGMKMPARGVAAFGVARRFDLLLLSAVAQPLAALLPYGCGTPLAGAALLIL